MRYGGGLERRQRSGAMDVANAYRAAGLEGAAAVLEILTIPNFAAWRWGTIYKVCREIRDVLGIIRTHLEVFLTALGKLKDGTHQRLIRVCVESYDWFCQFNFVDWFSERICTTQDWGGSCECHQHEW